MILHVNYKEIMFERRPCAGEVHEDRQKLSLSRRLITSSTKTQVISALFDLFL